MTAGIPHLLAAGRRWREYVNIYKHTSPSGKSYIGITSQTPEGRWQNGNGYNSQPFHSAIKKYGWESFLHYVWTGEVFLEYPLDDNRTPYVCNKSEACELERRLIKKYDSIRNGYNCSPGGEAPAHSVKMREKNEDGWYTPPLRSQTCNPCSHEYEKEGLRIGAGILPHSCGR